MRSNLLALAALLSLAAPMASGLMPSAALAAEEAGALPHRPAPAGLRAIEGIGGGRLLTGTLGHVPSTDAAFLKGLRSIHGYFDAPPDLVGAVRSQDGTVTLGTFTATLHGVPVNGVAYSIFDQSGSSRVAVAFDDTQRFGRTFRPLMQRFQTMLPTAGGGTSSRGLREVVADDRTASAKIPENWSVLGLRNGMFAGQGPDNALVVVRRETGFSDPGLAARTAQPYGLGRTGSPPMPATSDPVTAMKDASRVLAARAGRPEPETHVERVQPGKPNPGTAAVALIWGTEKTESGTRRFQRAVAASVPGNGGEWYVRVSELSTPAALWTRDLPLLTAIFNSYRYDESRQMQITIQRSEIARANNQRVFEGSMARARAAQDSIDQSAAAFSDYIGDKAVLSGGPGIANRRMDAGVAAGIAKADPRFHVLSLNEYRKGVDY